MEQSRNLCKRVDIAGAFGEAGILGYGPFKITKRPEQDFRRAAFYVYGKEVAITPQAKKTMALLISQQGGEVNILTYATSMDSEALSHTYNSLASQKTYSGRRESLEKLSNNLRQHIHQVREAIKSSPVHSPAEIESALTALRPVKPAFAKGEKGRQDCKKVCGYKLLDPTLEA